MVSLELAKKLKDAGLTWSVTLYDFCYYQERLCAILFAFIDKVIISPGFRVNTSECVFAPRLDQLLAEIERRNYELQLHMPCPGLALFDADGDLLETFAAETPEDAAAQALLYLLEREKEANP